MPIVGRTLKECAEQFRAILSKLSTSVLHTTKVVRTLEHDGRVLIGIFDGKGNISDVELDGTASPLFLRFWQTVAITPTDAGTIPRSNDPLRMRVNLADMDLPSPPDLVA